MPGRCGLGEQLVSAEDKQAGLFFHSAPAFRCTPKSGAVWSLDHSTLTQHASVAGLFSEDSCLADSRLAGKKQGGFECISREH